MREIELYNAIRNEIITNHTLMHWYSIAVAIVLLIGVWVIEIRKTRLSVFLPLLSVAWAAAMVRFDFFIQRQGAYLRFLEAQIMQNNDSLPMWETWKASLRATQIIVPIADVIACAVIVVPTIYLLFGPAQEFFRASRRKAGKWYAWSVSVILFLLLGSLLIIPRVSGWRN